MAKKVSEAFSLKGWDIWIFLQGRKKLLVTLIGMVGVQLALDPELVGLLAGGAVFEGLWALVEYWAKKVKIE